MRCHRYHIGCPIYYSYCSSVAFNLSHGSGIYYVNWMQNWGVKMWSPVVPMSLVKQNRRNYKLKLPWPHSYTDWLMWSCQVCIWHTNNYLRNSCNRHQGLVLTHWPCLHYFLHWIKNFYHDICWHSGESSQHILDSLKYKANNGASSGSMVQRRDL